MGRSEIPKFQRILGHMAALYSNNFWLRITGTASTLSSSEVLQMKNLPSLVVVLGDLDECSEELDGIVPDAGDAFSMQHKRRVVCFPR